MFVRQSNYTLLDQLCASKNGETITLLADFSEVIDKFGYNSPIVTDSAFAAALC